MALPSAKTLMKLSFDKFNCLPKTGKPTETEWTVLATITQYNSETNEAKVVSLGTGTKCIGHDQLCPNGLILNDSHAEIIARRGLIRYIYEDLLEKAEIFCYHPESRKFRLKNSISFHFFSSHVPCGDATIREHAVNYKRPVSVYSLKNVKESSNIDNTELLDLLDLSQGIRKARNFDRLNLSSNETCNQFPSSSTELRSYEPPEKRLKFTSEGEVFTGAKLLGLVTDPMYQEIGALRTKPGRGVRTLSMSCSDKLCKWSFLGIHGALLDILLAEPIYIKTFNFCGNTICKNSIKRAIYERWKSKQFENLRFHLEIPEIRVEADILFEYSQLENKEPSPASICWCNLLCKQLEVAVAGKKQGVTKKNSKTKNGSLSISRIKMFEKFLEILSKYPEIGEGIAMKNLNEMNYAEFKKLAANYQEAWKNLKTNVFGSWTQKSIELLKFSTKLRT